MRNRERIKSCLDRLAEGYGARFLDTDPVGIVHSYPDARDREVAGFIASSLAYGGAVQIRNSVRSALAPAGTSPADFAQSLTPEKALRNFGEFRHRWTDGGDMAFLFWITGRIIGEFGSVGALVRTLDNPASPNVEGIMIRFSEWITGRFDEVFRRAGSRNGISYLVPSPAGGSACKRLAMYFRWMARGPDDVDFGLWPFIRPSRLVIPVDRHIARMASILGLTSRSSPDWKMALDITGSLRLLDPDDPVRYDFALVRPGILRECTARSRGDCLRCLLREICREAL